ncbi:MAG: hypothetical protein JXA73_10200 [Acidobacteria bacterium]|nr:hypothetical protein [Acidobacteriota bacterium]
MKSKQSAFIIVVLLVFNSMTWGQISANEPMKKTQRHFTERGWQVPGLSHYDREKVHNKLEKHIDNTTVQMSSIKLDRHDRINKLFKFVVPSPDKPDKMIVRDVRINRILEYSINDRPFCYIVSMTPHIYDEKTGIGYSPAYEFSITYYDEDDSGRFKIMEYGNTAGVFGEKEINIPNWVKRFYNDNKQRH